MNILANWNGQLMPLHEVRVPALDRAFLFGDSVYEVIRVYNGRLWRMLDHRERLRGSLFKLGIAFPVELVQDRIDATLAASKVHEALVYAQVTRGVAPRHHHYPDKAEPNCLIWVQPFDDPYGKLRDAGGTAITYEDIRWARNDIKCTSLAANCAAANAAHRAGCLESIFIDRQGYVSEGSVSTIFAVKDGKLIVTPTSPAVLPGITKMLLIELCKLVNVPMQEDRIRKEDLCMRAVGTGEAGENSLAARTPNDAATCIDELFLTSTPEEIIPIIQVDGNPVGNGLPGPITRRLQHAFARVISEWLATEP